jgi:hypothetical protein
MLKWQNMEGFSPFLRCVAGGAIVYPGGGEKRPGTAAIPETGVLFKNRSHRHMTDDFVLKAVLKHARSSH